VDEKTEATTTKQNKEPENKPRPAPAVVQKGSAVHSLVDLMPRSASIDNLPCSQNFDKRVHVSEGSSKQKKCC